MTPQETVVLCRYVRACCPQQAMDEYTPDAWHDLIGDLDFADCREAVRQVARRQPFVAPSEIAAEVTRMRRDRLTRDALPPPPAELTDNQRAYKAWLDAEVARIADGHAVGPAIAPDRADVYERGAAAARAALPTRRPDA